MRLVVTLDDQNEMARFSALGADVFLVHPEALSCKTRHTFSALEITKLISDAHAIGKRLYVHLNRMIHEADLPALETLLRYLSKVPVDGIVCFDLTVVAMAEDFDLQSRIIYRPGTMNTNSYDPWFFHKLHLKGLTLSKEITLSEWIAIGENYQGMEISLVAHGYLDLFYSKRPLLRNYLIHRNLSVENLLNQDHLRLVEKTRPAEGFPILEDEAGTHIFRSRKLQSFQELKVLRPYLSDVFLERLFLSDAEYEAALLAYADESKEAAFLQTYGADYDSGRFYQRNVSPKEDDRS